MSPESFAYWLHGWSEINGGAAPNAQQWQIINDHLDLVFNKVTPDRGISVPMPPSGWMPPPAVIMPPTWPNRSPVVPWDGTEIAKSGFASGMRVIVDHDARLAYENHDKIFVTISREPIFDPKLTYSYYQYSKNWQDRATDDPATKSLLTGLGIQPIGEKVYVVVDNSLHPTKPTYADNMKGSSDHLTMLPDKGPGIINVGVGSPLIC